MEQIGRRAAIARIAGASAAAMSAQKRAAAATVRGSVLEAGAFAPYVRFFNAMVPEEVRNYVPNASAWDWMEANIPLFTCPDAEGNIFFQQVPGRGVRHIIADLFRDWMEANIPLFTCPDANVELTY